MKKLFVIVAVMMLIARCGKENDGPDAIVVTATGDISQELDQFRAMLGNVLNTTPGQSSGRREINWDGVPEIYATQKLPSDFFNPVADGSPTGLQRGFVYSADVDARISSNAFTDLESANGTEFFSFSGGKSFSAVNSNLWNVEFEVAGQRVDASVKGFGAVFCDVDDQGSTTIEYLSGTRSLGIFPVPAKSNGPYSFLGVYFPNEKVTAVRIRQGTAAVGPGIKDKSKGGTEDLVIMDDFLYDEPKALH